MLLEMLPHRHSFVNDFMNSTYAARVAAHVFQDGLRLALLPQFPVHHPSPLMPSPPPPSALSPPTPPSPMGVLDRAFNGSGPSWRFLRPPCWARLGVLLGLNKLRGTFPGAQRGRDKPQKIRDFGTKSLEIILQN